MEQMDRRQVLRHLSMKDCIELMRATLRDYAQGKSLQYLRTVTRLPADNLFGFMPAYLGDHDYFGAKVITVFPGNHQAGLPSHQGGVLLFDADRGTPCFMADGDAITQIRTGAVSAVATDLLASLGANQLAILGAGAQGRSHLEAVALVRKLAAVTVWDARLENAERFATEMADLVGCPILACASAKEAVENADIICTLTPSPTPILESGWVKSGAHINAVGACAPAARELDSALVARCRLYGDSVESVERESGDYLIPLAEGVIPKEHLLGTIGQLLCGEIAGRTSPEDVTLFDALGLAIEDVACAKYLYLAGKEGK
ncbi:MAG: ornithine cyclodeaminase family protein [Oscillospiraceae bacterium]|nr:ornithine cyclodeaminase family protein [Oscillospiraceae bacterium]